MAPLDVDLSQCLDCNNVEEIAKLFPKLFGQPPASLKAGGSLQEQSLKIGVVLSGGQAPGGHNVISGIFGEQIIELNMLINICVCEV